MKAYKAIQKFIVKMKGLNIHRTIDDQIGESRSGSKWLLIKSSNFYDISD